MVYDLTSGPYQLSLRPLFRREDPYLLEHIAFKELGQFVAVFFVCLYPAPTFSRDQGWRGNYTFNAIIGKPVIQIKSSRTGFVSDANVVTFKLSKEFFERIIVWPGKGYS